MASRQRTPLPHALCENLCSKKLYMISDSRDIALEDFETAGHEEYWCKLSFTDTGPDGGWVMYSRCTPERTCYQASASTKSLTYRMLESFSTQMDTDETDSHRG